MSIYIDNGYLSRNDYLKCLSEDFGISLKTVYSVAQLLGPDEDFDGLVVALEDESNRLELG